jgi:hypothetical protein
VSAALWRRGVQEGGAESQGLVMHGVLLLVVVTNVLLL